MAQNDRATLLYFRTVVEQQLDGGPPLAQQLLHVVQGEVVPHLVDHPAAGDPAAQLVRQGRVAGQPVLGQQGHPAPDDLDGAVLVAAGDQARALRELAVDGGADAGGQRAQRLVRLALPDPLLDLGGGKSEQDLGIDTSCENEQDWGI